MYYRVFDQTVTMGLKKDCSMHLEIKDKSQVLFCYYSVEMEKGYVKNSMVLLRERERDLLFVDFI